MFGYSENSQSGPLEWSKETEGELMEKVVREMMGPDLMRSYTGGCSDDWLFAKGTGSPERI